MERMVKCRSANCIHNDEPIPISEAVRVGNSTYYHKDCYEAKENLSKIIDIYYKQLNPNVVFSTLSHVLKEIIYKRRFDSNKLLFGVNWCINHGWNLRYPQGLFKVLENMEWQDEYDKMMRRNQPKVKVEITDEMDTPTFNYKPEQQRSFADILQ